MRRPPLTLWLHMLNELWRLILLTTCILVTVLSFAGAVRFLAEGKLGPIETIRWMFLMMPPMLQYALPFAAGFGATLAYHRCSTDNELTAGHAAGISHRVLLAPALASGVVLAGMVLLLSNLIIPRFLRSAEELITRDAARLIVNAIEHKEAVQMENTLLYADLVRRYDAGPGQDYEKLNMKGVYVMELDGKGDVKSQASAREADVWLRRVARSEVTGPDASKGPGGETVTQVTVQTKGMVGEQSTGRMADESNVFSTTIPNAFSDDPKFLSWGELVRLRTEPERLNVIDSRRRVLAAHLAERMVTTALATTLHDSGRIQFLGDEEGAFTLYASGIHRSSDRWIVDPGAGADGKAAPILIERRTASGRVARQEAESATFNTSVDPEAPEQQVTITLTLLGLTAGLDAPAPPRGAKREAPATPGSQLKPKTIGGLVVPNVDVAGTMAADTAELLKAADARLQADPKDDYVQTPRNDLRRRIADLMREVSSKQHERFASAAACLVMILTGAVMAIKLRAKIPLAVYLWAFFPALATVITISAGQQMIHAKGLSGIPVMWAGVAGLAAYTFVQYRHVARH